MKLTVFYSWQSDLPNKTNRGLIGDALEKAIRDLDGEVEITRDERPGQADDPEFLLDRDTQGVPGTPDIAHTIFDKIRHADVFLGDVSVVNQHFRTLASAERKFRPTPNPNVLIELGYAAHHHDWDRIICVFNLSYGAPSDLPFDLRNRRVLSYSASGDSDDRADQKLQLAGNLRSALLDICPAVSAARQNVRTGQQVELLVDHRLEIPYSGKRHQYFLLIDIENKGPAEISQFRLDVWFPKAFLDIETYGFEVQAQETGTHKLIQRTQQNFNPYNRVPMFVGNTLHDELIRYSVSSERFNGLLDLPVEVVLYAGGMEAVRVKKPLRSLQNF